MTTEASVPCLTLTSPADVLAAVPYLVGFHPADSLVVIGLGRGRAKVVARWGLPLPPGTLAPLVPLFERESVSEVVVVGYGPGDQVTPAVDEATAAAARAGVEVSEALRADGGRFWSYVCDSVLCCPPEGTAYDPRASRIAAEATVRGLVALPDRQALLHTIEPVTGPVRVAMRGATAEVAHDLRARLAGCADADAFARTFTAEGLARVRAALALHASGGRLDDVEAARLGLDLAVIRVRDEAWTLLEESHAGLWKDLTRRLEPAFVPAVASLLAMAAWRSGDSTLAGIALERALTADPDYSMAHLLRHALQQLMSPDMLKGRLPSPAELDAAMGEARASWLLPLLDRISADDPPGDGGVFSSA